MKAFIAYDEGGRITDVGIPNPEFGEDVVMEATDGDSIVDLDCSEVLKTPRPLAFAASGKSVEELQRVMQTIIERYRIDPVTRRLVSKLAPDER